ncbi:MAG: YidB family protein [Spongiibacteraceae bacterium]
MGLLDDLMGAMNSGGAASAGSADVMGALTGLLGSSGGLAGIVQSFEQAGLGNLVQSWVSTGQNLPVTGEQIMQALSGGQFGALASQLNLQNPEVANMIAQMLPQLINQLTPNGTMPQAGDLMGSLTSFAQNFFKT